MSYTTKLYCQIPFWRFRFRSREDVESDLQAERQNIEWNKQMLHDMAVRGLSNDPLTSEYEPSFNDLLSDLEGCIIEAYKLEQLLNHWDECHSKDDRPILPPKEIEGKAFIDGDYFDEEDE